MLKERTMNFKLGSFILLLILGFNFSAKALNVTPPNKVVYGVDNRVEAYRSTKLQIAKSTMALIHNDLLTPDVNFAQNQKYNLPDLKFGYAYGLCSYERFFEQGNPANCSGSLIAKNLVLTAGHCITDDYDCAKYHFVFDYRVSANGSFPKSVQASQVYSCKRIINRTLTDYYDYALIELDRDVVDREPIQLELNANLKAKDKVFVIGHPSGLPTKVGAYGLVRKTYSEYFSSNLDTYGGNSGSPVFNKDNRQVGILVRGEWDYDYDTKNFCNFSHVCSSTGCSGEESTNIAPILRENPIILETINKSQVLKNFKGK